MDYGSGRLVEKGHGGVDGRRGRIVSEGAGREHAEIQENDVQFGFERFTEEEYRKAKGMWQPYLGMTRPFLKNGRFAKVAENVHAVYLLEKWSKSEEVYDSGHWIDGGGVQYVGSEIKGSIAEEIRRGDGRGVEAWAREDDPYWRKCGGMAGVVSKVWVLLRNGEVGVQAEAVVDADNQLSET